MMRPHWKGVGAQSQSPLLRKFDEAERYRQRVDLGVDLTLGDRATATLSAGWREDDYLRSTLGLQRETTMAATCCP